jgi:transposase
MHHPPPIPPELWEQIPPHVRTVVEVIIDVQAQRIATLETQVVSLRQQLRVLRERLSQNSQNSSKPPSSDGPHVKRRPPKALSGRKPGGQPGHPVHCRTLLPLEPVSEVIACVPTHCRRCGQRVQGVDPEPLRHQVVEVPPIGGAAKATGEILLEHSNVLFAWWHWVREGAWTRSTLQW